MFRTHQEDKPENISEWTRFLWRCSGATVSILEETPTDKVKYEGIGGIVCTTAILAFFSSTYALYLIFNKLLASFLAGLVWSLIIFNLDRYIVSTIEKRGRWWRELGQAAPRFALAVVIAVVVSHPLKLKIFEKEISAELLKEEHFSRRKDLNEQIERIRTEQEDIGNKLNEVRSSLKERRNQLVGEMQGPYRGYGPIATKIDQLISQQKEEFDREVSPLQSRLDELDRQRVKLEKDMAQEDAAYNSFTEHEGTSARKFGILDRIRTLGDLKKSDDSVWHTDFFISVLFIILESAPVLFKLLTPVGAYDMKLETRRQSTEKEEKLKRDHLFERHDHYYASKTVKDKELVDFYIEEVKMAHKEDIKNIISDFKENPEATKKNLLQKLTDRITYGKYKQHLIETARLK
jgi:hypothetical protein